jgi:SAM-dependent methyltransferase
VRRQFALGLLALSLAACASPRPDVIYLPTAPDVVQRMLALARITERDTVYDLGCGDGRIVITAVKQYGARGVCVDIDPARIAESRRNAEAVGVAQQIRFEQGDLFETDLHDATVVTLYLLPKLNYRLRPKLFRELRPGTRILSHNFDMAEWRPDTLVRVAWPAGTTSTVYYWVLPAEVAGTWAFTLSTGGTDRSYRIRFEQEFQHLTGTASSNGRLLPVEGAGLVGDSITFTVTDTLSRRQVRWLLRGKVASGLMSGTAAAESGGTTGTWRAARP